MARIAVLASPGDRRREKRYSTDAPAILSFTEGTEWCDCRILDVSRSGLRLRCTRQFATGATLHIVLPGGSEITGEARYSRPVEGGWDTGVRIVSHTATEAP